VITLVNACAVACSFDLQTKLNLLHAKKHLCANGIPYQENEDYAYLFVWYEKCEPTHEPKWDVHVNKGNCMLCNEKTYV